MWEGDNKWSLMKIHCNNISIKIHQMPKYAYFESHYKNKGHANWCPGHWLSILKKEIITIKGNCF